METTALRRLTQVLGATWSSFPRIHILGFLVGFTHVGWIVLVILFVDLMLSEGQLRIPDDSTAEFVSQLLDREVTAGRSTVRNSGLLPLVVESRNHWPGPILEAVYRRMSWTQGDASYLMGLLVIALCLGIARLALAYFHTKAIAKAVVDFGAELRRKLFVRKFSLGSEALERETDAKQAHLLRESAGSVQAGVSAILELLPRDAVRIVTLTIAAMLVNIWLGLIFVLLTMLVAMIGSMWVRVAAQRKEKLSIAADAAVDRLCGLADKTRLIKGYAADEYFKRHYDRALEDHRKSLLAREEHSAAVMPIGQVLALVVILTLLGVAGQNVLADRFGVAGAVGVLACLLGIGWSGLEWIMKRSAIAEAEEASAKILDFLEGVSPGVQAEGTSFLPAPSSAIEFDRVTFRDANGRTLLDNVSCRIPANSRTILLATDPAEARAFVDLLCRFIDPNAGSIRFDGKNLRDFTLESVRAQVCLVLGDELLFPDTVANNIGCGDPSFSREKIVEASKVAHAHHFVERLPGGYGCLVGEGGRRLTVGEALRISLARVVLRDPSVAVIEEPDLPLDTDSKHLLDDTLRRFLKRRTSIILPRSWQTLILGERVIVIDKGKVVAAGTHQELHETNPVYRFLLLARFSEAAKIASRADDEPKHQ